MASLIDGDLKTTGKVSVGNAATPPDISGGSGAMVTTNKANGSIHLRTDADTVPEVLHNGSVEKLGFAQNSIECRLSNLVANGSVSYTTHLPRNAIVTAIRRRYATAPASASGTVVAGVTMAGNQILASASENEEGLSNDTLTAHNLTGTAAHLKGTKGAKIVITITSNNADMTGGTEGMYYIDYECN